VVGCVPQWLIGCELGCCVQICDLRSAFRFAFGLEFRLCVGCSCVLLCGLLASLSLVSCVQLLPVCGMPLESRV
jgi:hypothetical protein